MTTQRIHLVFKTHLDIGFTDHAEKVRRQYHDQFIPQAISTAEHFYAENPEAPAFIWTTGAWLIWDHLQSQDAARVARLERAIERGLIRWHGLPYTTHTELMSPALFSAGLSYSQELDKRFGKTTIAAKMTDVPGHTLGMVPLMAEAGIRFLHLGVNTASPVPDVPGIFRWHAPNGDEIVVMYQGSYGETEFPAGDDVGLSFAHTNDNVGPQSVGQTVEACRGMFHAHPGAEIVASTLDAFGAEMWARRADFPVLDIEIGDSWIHGAGSDPIKMARFRQLQRLYDSFAENDLTPERLAFGRGLAMVAEHTCGVDIKTYLRDELAWDRPEFTRARRDDYRFAYTEASWAEQRAFLDAAVAALEPVDRALAVDALAELGAGAAPSGALSPGVELSSDGWTATLDPATGDIAALTSPDGITIAGRDGVLLGYRYESYDFSALQTHLDTYLQHRAEWAVLDHDKPGLAGARTARTETDVPAFAGIAGGAGGAVAIATLPAAAHAELGAPRQVEFSIRGLDRRSVEITLILRDKPANRMPEASFLSLTPAYASAWDYSKMGLWQDGARIARKGGGQLQAVNAVRSNINGLSLTVTPLDTALVAPASSPFMAFSANPPDLSAGLRFNLHNNKWGTNFPMWWEGDFKTRLVLTLD
ncbi:glycosyl hydrolase [Devosia limi DSM 17137]|uniref:Glycosyl hydrolase n=1 Tax=Devosia limi DSM 17137 TaxID=1121477 RepID=A0A0F5LYD5_9HYPH|nr:DUF5054 domain-containing protein [Devosia limi]KKB86647.1 glycosyl hydrolase [Devosia limi DSM 17137]SHE35997.1 protein of unknown function [Devosia limi DSM 17137]